MGWALKTIKKKVRFTRKQTEFLTDQFQKGEYSGRKSDPQEVSKTMSLARDQAGERRFQPDEVLTSQQISGFFSRLSGKKRLEVTAAGNEAKASEVSEVDMESVDEDEISTEAESHLSAVCANVIRDVAIQHPIVSFDLNPLTPKISFVILFIVCHTIHVMLVWRIWTFTLKYSILRLIPRP